MKSIAQSALNTVLFSLLAIVAGCATLESDKSVEPEPAESSTLEAIDVLLESAQEQPSLSDIDPIVPTGINQALLPPLNLDDPLEDPRSLEERFDIDVANAEIRTLLMGLVSETPYNMVIHPDVSGKISLSLKDVSIPDVMRILRDVYGYEYQTSRNGFHVLPVAIQSRIYHLNYLNIERTGFSQTRVSSGQVTNSDSSDSDSAASSGGSSTSGSVIETSSTSNLWAEMKTSLQSIIGNGDGRTVVVSPQSGMVIVRAMPNELREVENFLRVTQGNLHRQVILEAKIVEVELNDGFQAGINWSALGDDGDDTLLVGQTGGGSIFTNGNTLDANGNTTVLNPAAFGGVFSAALKIDDFTGFIELLETQGSVQVLSSPRVSTVNNQKAVIKVGQDEFFVTEISSSDISGTGNTGNTTTPDITLTPFFSGIALDVTPQIDVNGGVVLHIHPTVSEVVDQTKNITVNGQTQSLPLALSSVRESDSIVHARSGQLIVIGGLMQNRTEDDTASTPFFGDLPVIGSLFRHKRERYLKSELVILLRPIVVNSTGTWAHSLQESAERIRGIE
ncbi:MAG: pilus (MSHA type) biogenesis protein MshL [Pseudomonadota bacterium]